MKIRGYATRLLLASATAAALMASALAGGASAQGVPVEASSVIPTATILLDTSGGMEFLPGQPTGPPVCACVNPPAAANCPEPLGHEWPLGLDVNGNPVPITYWQLSNVESFYNAYYAPSRTRFHYALEALGGTIENFFCAWDYRNINPDRVDQVDPDRPQGIPHARACSYDPEDPPRVFESAQAYLNRSCGPNVIQASNGIVPQSSSLVYFGLATMDSFRERTQDAEGMYSYACDPTTVQGRINPDPADPDADCMGIRAATDDTGSPVDGGLVLPDLASGSTLPEQAADLVRERLRTIVPYWSTPLSAAFHDLWHMLTYEPVFEDDPQALCRPHNVIFVGDGVPTFEICWELFENNLDPLPGCENYWYGSLMENLERLHLESRQPPGENTDYELPVRIFPIGFGLTGEELAASRLGDLSRFTGSGDDRIIDVPEDPNIPVPPDDPNLWLAENVAAFESDLGRALAAILSNHVVSRSVPFTTTAVRNFFYDDQDASERIVMSRFRGVSSINPRSSFWSGDVERYDWICAPDEDGIYTIQERLDEDGAPLSSWSYAQSLDEQIAFPAPGGLGDEEVRAERRVYTNLSMHTCSLGPVNEFFVATPFQGTPGVTSLTLVGADEPNAITVSEADAASFGTSGRNLLQGNISATGLAGPLDRSAQPDALCMGPLDADRVARSSNFASSFGGRLLRFDTVDVNDTSDEKEVQVAAQRVIEWVRGANLQELVAFDPAYPPPFPTDPDEFNFVERDRASAMGAVLFSSPQVVGPPAFGLPFSGYQEFLDRPLNPAQDPNDPEGEDATLRERPTTMYVNSDSGLLHAFDAASGEELWAFMPRYALPSLRRAVRTRPQVMEGSPVVRDMRVSRGPRPDGDTRPTELWSTILVSGMRDGGRGFYAIDVTIPDRPVFLWQMDAHVDAQIGLTYGQPALATVSLDADTCARLTTGLPHADRPDVALDVGRIRPGSPCQRGVAILPGGVHPEGLTYAGASNIGKVMHVVDVLTGRVIRRFNTIDVTPEGDGERLLCDTNLGYCRSSLGTMPQICMENGECVGANEICYIGDPFLVRDPELECRSGSCVRTGTTAQRRGTCSTLPLLPTCANSGSTCEVDGTTARPAGYTGTCDGTLLGGCACAISSCSVDADCGFFSSPQTGVCRSPDAIECTSTLDCAAAGAEAIPAAISGSVAAFDTFAGNLATRAFVGDVEGRMLRLDMSSADPEAWRLEVFFDPEFAAKYDGIETLTGEEEEVLSRRRPILYRPVIAYLDNLTDAVIIYGQGDVDSLSRIAIGEVGTDNLIFSLVERPRFDADGLLNTARAQVNWILHLGVPRGEGEPDRAEILTVQPRIFNRVVYFATFVEDDDPCRMGDPRLYGLHYTGPLFVSEDPDGLSRFVRLSEPEDSADPATREHAIVGMFDTGGSNRDFWIEAVDEDGALVQTRSVINSIDIVQLPSCFDPGGEGFGSESGAAQFEAGGTGEFRLFVSASRAGDPDSPSSADRQARQVQTSLSLPRPQQPALPTSWGTIVPW